MIDLRAARSNPDAIRAALARRGDEGLFDAAIAADDVWRELVPQVDALRAKQRKPQGKPTPEELAELKQIKEELQALEEKLDAAEAERNEILAKVPNPPDPSAPDGGEDDAVEIRRVGETGPGSGKEHTEVGRFEMDRAAKVSGARFGYIVGDTALLSMALYRFALETVAKHGHTPMLPPVLVRDEAMYGTGFFPSDKGDYYEIPADGLYLVGTSEVPLAAFHMGDILEDVPLRYVAFSSCFRRESGSAGRDTRGMFRVHQFQKVEMFVFCDPATSTAEHERILSIEEELVQAVGLPYRVINVAAGDLGASAAKKYDIEAWFPSQQRYREITSCSNTTDYQARRLGVRWREGEKQLTVPHTLNGTAVTDRWVLAILENFGGDVPDVLQSYGAPARIES